MWLHLNQGFDEAGIVMDRSCHVNKFAVETSRWGKTPYALWVD